MAARQNYVRSALSSYSGLNETIGSLTEEEVFACLELEKATQRRRSIIDRLISRAVRIRELAYKLHLQEKFHGSH